MKGKQKRDKDDLENFSFWNGKIVLVTGHTGFKGAWLTIWLHKLGAKVIGYSLKEYPNDKMFNDTGMSSRITDIRGDISDLKTLKSAFDKYKPQIVFHMAAQPLVRLSYDDPVRTLQTNVMGTVNVLECIRLSDSVQVAVMITSDKCYRNKNLTCGYKEGDELGGVDPYSCSKACSELVVSSYRDAFLKLQSKIVASVRAGNVIGGGDWSQDRLIPDCIKALQSNKPILIRNPDATRPWQHVLEPLSGYLMLAEKLWQEKRYDEGWNFGPHTESIVPVRQMADMLVKKWGSGSWVDGSAKDHKHEAKLLSLDITKIQKELGWKPKLKLDEAIEYVVEWYKNSNKKNAYELCIKQINSYENK
jgi:CDP-glucose 4,6-dehydratase